MLYVKIKSFIFVAGDLSRPVIQARACSTEARDRTRYRESYGGGAREDDHYARI